MSTAEQIADEIYGLHCDIGRLETENAKLRKELADIFRDFVNADDELRLRHGRTFMAWERYEPRLRELGVDLRELGVKS